MEQKYAASAIIYNNEGLVLLARRSPTKRPYPNVLSLPSTYLREESGKLIHSNPSYDIVIPQLKKAVHSKLGINVHLDSIIGMKNGTQADYNLTMMDFVGHITGANITPNGEDFSEAGFYNPAKLLNGKDRSRMGFCTQILLEKLDEDPEFLVK